jgi:hypothetical protein
VALRVVRRLPWRRLPVLGGLVSADDSYQHQTTPARRARRFELHEVDDETGARLQPAPIYIVRWDLEHPPAYLVSGPIPVGDGLTVDVEVRHARRGDLNAAESAGDILAGRVRDQFGHADAPYTPWALEALADYDSRTPDNNGR